MTDNEQVERVKAFCAQEIAEHEKHERSHGAHRPCESAARAKFAERISAALSVLTEPAEVTSVEKCPTCGCDPRYPTGVHVVDCGNSTPEPTVNVVDRENLAERLRQFAESQRMDFDSPHVALMLEEAAHAILTPRPEPRVTSLSDVCDDCGRRDPHMHGDFRLPVTEQDIAHILSEFLDDMAPMNERRYLPVARRILALVEQNGAGQ